MGDCPCKRVKCPRHGECENCREYHKTSRWRVACDQEAPRQSKGKNRRNRKDKKYPK